MPKITVKKVWAPKEVGWKESYLCERADGASTFFSRHDLGDKEHKEGEEIEVSETTFGAKINKDKKIVPREWKAKEGAVIPPKVDPLQNVAINGVVSPTHAESKAAELKPIDYTPEIRLLSQAVLQQLQTMNEHFHKLEAVLGTIDHGLETVLPLFDTKLERILGAIEKGEKK